MQKESTLVVHPLKPVYDKNSRALILGTMPSPKSREYGFYYSHPQNRFWRVAAGLYNAPVPETNEAKASFLLQHRIAMWDVLKSCRIAGADDASISEPVPNDIAGLLKKTNIRRIFTTGTKATSLYRRFCYSKTGMVAVPLPSTSPANCRWPYEKLLDAYRIILHYTEHD